MKQIPLTILTGLFLMCSLNTYSQNPKASFSVNGGLDHCIGDTIKFKDQSTGNTSVIWDFGDDYTTYIQNPIHLYEVAGQYTVTLTAVYVDSNTGGATRHSTTLTVNISLPPTVTIMPSGDTTILAGQELTLTTSGTFNTIKWSTGETTKDIKINKAGRYWCTVTDNNGCTGSDTSGYIKLRQAPISDTLDIIVENNIITDNDDGFNEFLIIRGFEDYTSPIIITIYNVWGQKIYESEDYQNDWDARANDKPIDTGTYFFNIKSTGKRAASGFIDVIR